MPNSHSISPETWAHARQCLIFYFSRRHARSDAEDLAQETLLALWNREDYEFAKDEDFLKVCYGFARRILLEGYRETQRHAATALDPSHPAPQREPGSQRATESSMLLAEVCAVGQSQLTDKEWNLITMAAERNRTTIADELKLGGANNVRVRLHRARKKLAKLTGLGGS
jgi:RNA polymerase sigma factor (sigma-70 family)